VHGTAGPVAFIPLWCCLSSPTSRFLSRPKPGAIAIFLEASSQYELLELPYVPLLSNGIAAGVDTWCIWEISAGALDRKCAWGRSAVSFHRSIKSSFPASEKRTRCSKIERLRWCGKLFPRSKSRRGGRACSRLALEQASCTICFSLFLACFWEEGFCYWYCPSSVGKSITCLKLQLMSWLAADYTQKNTM
jgi:hypothetical protein